MGDANDQKQSEMHTKKQMVYTKETKLAFKIAQRPTINEMKSRGLMYDDPLIPASLQHRKRELHRRRASKKLEAFLLKRPNKETLKRRHIMLSPQNTKNKQIKAQRLRKHIKQRPS